MCEVVNGTMHIEYGVHCLTSRINQHWVPNIPNMHIIRPYNCKCHCKHLRLASRWAM